jgi:hypothetical protein
MTALLIVLALVAWFVVAVPLAILVGRVLAAGSRPFVATTGLTALPHG